MRFSRRVLLTGTAGLLCLEYHDDPANALPLAPLGKVTKDGDKLDKPDIETVKVRLAHRAHVHVKHNARTGNSRGRPS